MVDAIWEGIEALLLVADDGHPLGGHNPKISDRLCFEGIMIRLVTGCSWEDAERLAPGQVSDTTLRTRRDEWIAAGVFDQLVAEALAGYDRMIGLDLGEVSVDGSAQGALWRRGNREEPDRSGQLGWKWSLLADRAGISIGWATNGAEPPRCGAVRTHPDRR